MHRLASVAAIALLAASLGACKKAEPAPDATMTTDAMATDAAMASGSTAAMAAGGTMPAAGDYTVYSADGKENAKVKIAADGGYRHTMTGKLATAGVVKMEGGKTCFHPSGGKAPTCYVDSAPGADGSFTATMDDGTVMTVKPAK